MGIKQSSSLRYYILAAASGLAITAPAALADGFDLSEKLSVTGFIDMSTTYFDPDEGESDSNSGLDQFEIDLIYDFGNRLTAQVDLEYQNGNADTEEVDLEQAFISYAVTDSFSLKAGRFLSYSGWETEEPTGLFQYSGTGYAPYFYGYYQQGVSALYTSSMFDVALSVVNSLVDPKDRESKELGTEFMVAFHPIEGWTTKAFYMVDALNDDPMTAVDESDEDLKMFNIWTSYSMGGLTLAAEYNDAENSGGYETDGDGYLLMANYAWDKYGITLRYHDFEIETDSGSSIIDANAITISPSYKVNDNLLFVFEYRMDEYNDSDSDSWAFEALVTF